MRYKPLENSRPATFLHSGQVGDLIYGLPTIRALGGGVLFLAPDNRGDVTFPRHLAEQTGTLLRCQPYLTDVRLWADEPVDYNLDRFRDGDTQRGNLAALHLAAFGLPFSCADAPWLDVPPLVVPGKSVVFQRTPRYRNPAFSWHHIYQNFGDRAVLVGIRDEHRAFEADVGIIDCFRPRDFLEMASLIRGAELFIGNSSCGLAMAVAMRHPNVIHEVYPAQPISVFDRPEIKNCWSYP